MSCKESLAACLSAEAPSRLLGTVILPRETVIMNSSVQGGTSLVPNQMLLMNGTAVLCAKHLEIPVVASAVGYSPLDAKDLPELDKSAEDFDHDSPLRMSAVLRTLFKAAEAYGFRTRNLLTECEYEVTHESGCNQTLLRMEDNFRSTGRTDKSIKIEMAEKNRNEEIILSKDESLKDFQEESGTTELDSRSNSCQTVEETERQTQEEELALESTVHMANLTMAHEQGKTSSSRDKTSAVEFTGLNHVAFCCENLEKTLEFYCGLLGLKTNPDRPDLPYRGAWLLLGSEGLHIMEVPNPDPVQGRPQHGGWDRHACLNCTDVESIRKTLDKAGIPYQISMVPSLFCRDPDGNGLEFIELNPR